VLLDNSQGLPGCSLGIALDRNGDLLVANGIGVLRVHTDTKQTEVISAGGRLVFPLGIVPGRGNDLFVLNIASPREIIRVNAQTRAQSVVSRGGLLTSPQSLTRIGDDLFVTDVATPDGNFGVGRVIRINTRTGVQTVVAEGGYLVGPVGIAGDQNGQL